MVKNEFEKIPESVLINVLNRISNLFYPKMYRNDGNHTIPLLHINTIIFRPSEWLRSKVFCKNSQLRMVLINLTGKEKLERNKRPVMNEFLSIYALEQRILAPLTIITSQVIPPCSVGTSSPSIKFLSDLCVSRKHRQ
ncbi:hypothetical protein LOAG_08832, partial [Loa loa]